MTVSREAPRLDRLPRSAPRSVAHNSATVAGWTLVSRATGLLRVVVIGAVLGPTFLANTFLTTNNLPNLAYSVVAGPVLALVVVPTVVRVVLERGPGECGLFVRRLSGVLITVAAGVALLLVPLSLVLARVLSLGVPEADRGRAELVATVLLLLVAPQVVLYTVAALGAAVQQARQRYALAAAAPAVENVGLMITMAGVAVLHRPGTDVGTVPLDVVLLMGAGTTLSVGLHAAVQVVGAHRVGLPLHPAGGWRGDPAVRAVLARLRDSVPVAVLPAGSFFLLLAYAGSMPGGVLVFQMAFAVYVVPTALGARAVTTAVMPGMSAAAKAGDGPRYAAAWRQAVTYCVVAGLPALCVLAVLARPIAGILAAGDLWDDELITALAASIAVLAVAQLAAGLHEVGRQALFARLDVRGPRRAVILASVLTAGCGGAALLLPAGLPRSIGLACVVLLADVATAATVVGLVRRAIRPEPTVAARDLGVVALAGAAMLPVLAGGWVLTRDDGHAVDDLVVMGATATLAAILFVLVLTVLTRRRAAP